MVLVREPSAAFRAAPRPRPARWARRVQRRLTARPWPSAPGRPGGGSAGRRPLSPRPPARPGTRPGSRRRTGNWPNPIGPRPGPRPGPHFGPRPGRRWRSRRGCSRSRGGRSPPPAALLAAVIAVVLGRAVPLAVLVPLAVRRVPVSAALTPRLGGAIALVPVAAFFPVLATLPVLALIAGGLPLADGSGVPVGTCGGDVRGGARGGAVPLSARIPGVPLSARGAGVPFSARIPGVPLVTRGGRAPPALLAFVALRGTGLAADRARAVAPGLEIVVRVNRVGLPRHRRKTAGRTARSHVVTLRGVATVSATPVVSVPFAGAVSHFVVTRAMIGGGAGPTGRTGAAVAGLRGRTGRIRPRPPGPLAAPVGRCAGAFSAPVSHKSEVIVLSWRGKVVAIFFRYAWSLSALRESPATASPGGRPLRGLRTASSPGGSAVIHLLCKPRWTTSILCIRVHVL